MKKKILLIITLIVLLVPAFIFLVPIKDGRTFYREIKYKRLLADAVQPDNYDKMKISYVRIVDRKTGTPSFNTPDGQSVDDGSILSNAEGIDVSEKDDYVRTFDDVIYTIEVGVVLNLDHPDVDETTVLKGGVIKIKTSTGFGENASKVLFCSGQSWQQNSRCDEDSYSIHTVEYHVPEDETIVGGNQQLTFSFETGIIVDEITAEQMPKFEVWMEGNEPDNEESQASSITIQDEGNLYITGKVVYDVGLMKANIAQPGKKDGVYGYYLNFLPYIRVVDSLGKGGKGMARPTQKDIANIKMKIDYLYREKGNNGAYKNVPDTDATGKSLTPSIVTFNLHNRAASTNAYPYYYSNYDSNASDYYASRYMPITGTRMCSDCDYKQMESSPTLEYEDGIISITNTDIINTWPGAKITSWAEDALVGDAVEIFVPYYEIEGVAGNQYKVQISIDDFSIDNESMKSQEIRTNNNSIEYTYKDYLSGEFTTYFNSFDGVVIINGESNEFYSGLRVADGPYEGGSVRLFTFDASIFDLSKDEYSGKYTDVSLNITNSDYTYSTYYVKFKYGIYKNNPQEGLTSDALVNSTVIDDFDWYTSVNTANSHGKITAILVEDPKYRGYGESEVMFYLSAVNNKDNADKVGIVRQKAWIYQDAEKTKVFELHTNTDPDYYKGTLYDENGYLIRRESPESAGESNKVWSEYADYDANVWAKSVNTNASSIETKYEEVVLNYSWYQDDLYTDNYIRDIYVDTEVDSPYLTYKEGSCNYEPSIVNIDGNKVKLHFDFKNYNLAQGAPRINCNYYLDPLTPNNTYIKILGGKVGSDDFAHMRTIYRYEGFTVINLSGSSTTMIPSREIIDPNETIDITGNVNNISDGELENVKTIQILPKNGNDRGDIVHGSYTIDVTSLADGMTLYYSTGNINDIGIETDSIEYKHIKNVDLANDDRWIQVNVGETIPENATAIATLTETISTNSSKEYTYSVTFNGNEKGDKYSFYQYASSDQLQENIFSSYKTITVVSRKINGTVFEDLNRNDLLNDTDAKLNGYTVELLNEEGTKIDEKTTDSNGHYEFELNNKGIYYIKFNNIPEGYETIPKTFGTNGNHINSNLLSDSVNQSTIPHSTTETTTVNYGIRKKAATITRNYINENTGNSLTTSTTNTVYYTEDYQTSCPSTVATNYSFVRAEGDTLTGTVDKDIIVIDCIYDLTPATVTAKHYLDGTEMKIHEDVIQNLKFTQGYSTSALDTTDLVYEYVRADGDSTSGTVSKKNIVVNYYYKYKQGTVTTHHYLYDNGETTTPLAEDTTRKWNYTETYTTEVSEEVPKNYELYKKTDNYTNIMSSPSVEVTYYYRLKDSNLITSITKTGDNEITAKDAEVNYTITYNAEVKDYLGDGTITIVDTLPYAIDVDNSDIAGGTYDANSKTITWEEEWTNINPFDEQDETSKKTITKNIKLVYVGIVDRDRIMTNTTTGNIVLSNNSRESQAQTSTTISIKGNIKVIHVDKETGESIADDIEETNLVGEQYVSSAIEKDGYKLVTKPDSEEFEFEEENQLIIYEYEHIKFEIKGVVLGVGGTITGDEDVFWGEDSTVDNIVVQADEGYIIEAIIVNGERIELVLGEEKVVLNNFVNVLEDKNIEVVFAKKPQENPNTKASLGWLLFFSWIIAGLAIILIKKTKELE